MKSGSSFASVANSSMTTSSRGSGRRRPQRGIPCRSSTPASRSSRSRWRSSASRHAQRALAELLVEVGDHADRVREPRALVERAAALVVDEDERQVRRVGVRRQAGDEAAQQLALAGARRAGDQPVRAVATRSSPSGPLSAMPIGAARARPCPAAFQWPRSVSGGGVEVEDRDQRRPIGQVGTDRGDLPVLPTRPGARAVATTRSAGTPRHEDVRDLHVAPGSRKRASPSPAPLSSTMLVHRTGSRSTEEA